MLLSQAEAEPEPQPVPAQPLGAESEPALQAELEPEGDAAVELTEPEPELDERTQQLRALTQLGVQQWSAAQVLEWVALADLPPESVPVINSAFKSIGVDDGEELLELGPKILQKKLAKHGAKDSAALAKQVIAQRDALIPGGNTAAAAPTASESPECPICMEPFCDDASGLRVPRLLTSCGHTVCHGCITGMLALVTTEKKKNKKNKKKGGAKACKCPTCSKDTEVEGGDASSLLRNWLAM